MSEPNKDQAVELKLASGQTLLVDPEIMPGWICDCRTYNGILRMACKHCGKGFLCTHEEMAKFLTAVRVHTEIPLMMLLDIVKASIGARNEAPATELFEELLRRSVGSGLPPATMANVAAAVSATICQVYSSSTVADFLEICSVQWADRLTVSSKGEPGGGKTH